VSDCPVCYNFVNDQVRSLRSRFVELYDLIVLIKTTPPQDLNTTGFMEDMASLNKTVIDLLYDAYLVGK